jgi:hypothetical protein
MMSDAEDVCERLERDHDNAVRNSAAAFQQAVALKPKKLGGKADANDQTVPAKRGRGRPVGSKNKPKGMGEPVLEHCFCFGHERQPRRRRRILFRQLLIALNEIAKHLLNKKSISQAG